MGLNTSVVRHKDVGSELSYTEYHATDAHNLSALVTGRSATLVVAASDSSKSAGADYLCDGTADEVEIQAAMDALPSVGGKVVLLEGTFAFAAGVTELSDNVHIQGQGIEATKIVPADGVMACTFGNASVFNQKFCSLSDLSISATSQQTSGGGVSWQGDCYQMALRRVRTSNLYDAVVVNCYLSGPADPRAETGWIEDCTFWDTKNIVLDLQRLTGLSISRCNAYNTTDSLRGIRWQQGGGLFISDCDFMLCGTGFFISAGAGGSCKWLFLSNVALDTCSGNALLITGAGQMEHFQLSNLHISTSGLDGISTYPASDTNHIHFTNLRIISCAMCGAVLDGVDDVSILGGYIGANNTADGADAWVQQGIYINGSTNLRIEGLRASNADPGTGYQKYGIFHNSGGSNVLVQGCDLGGNQTGGFYSGDWTKVMVRDNAGAITEQSGTDTIASGQTTKAVTFASTMAAVPTVLNINFREQGTADYGRWWVSSLATTGFTLNVSVDPGVSNLDFAYEAKVR